ncbi:16S rRNA (cytidine(1402)-2'-O)-methyltransferase [Roseospirillum parvum]|uniref:Ribosomal RNA small subunit methyltransferase I n=1 Tax=Roseospirillum parvum TaxID=83401 RepID=A0A1G7Z940_9PROT|nr:16S rRNA (cytidine1402-2'-O)-methyltransferase [Roseospirillum parvum]
MATPIGNLGDFTERARAVLAGVDLIACEDTRVTGRLCGHFGITTPRQAYHEHNAARERPRLLARLAAGERIALVSDAGTPLISDPGYRLVAEARAAGHAVRTVPGASAVMAALTVAGLPTDRFLFAGFLPPKGGPRRRAIAELAPVPATLVLFESPRRLPETLADLAEGLDGGRLASVCRELTKLYEEVRHGSLAELAGHYAAEGPPKGEVVLVIAPPEAPAAASQGDIDAALRQALDEGLSVRDAARRVSERTDTARHTVYARALALKNGEEDAP